MGSPIIRALALAASLATMAHAQTPAPPKPQPSPGEIVAAAPATDWTDIAPNDLLVMTLAPDAKGKARTVLIQLMPPPFSQGWIGNIRKLAAAHWFDGIAVVRVQDNYVVQWGDPDGEDPKKAKPLPGGLTVVPESDYVATLDRVTLKGAVAGLRVKGDKRPIVVTGQDAYSGGGYFRSGWPVAFSWIDHAKPASQWPVHCYGMVGVGRNVSPDTGTGAELYTVIGHAPRHLDRNIALVGRVVEGIEHLSSLPRGTGALGFYEKAEERVPILSIRVASDLPAAEQPHVQYLSTESPSFARYAHARANRHDDFFIAPAGGADICNVPVPIRRRP